MKIIYDAKDLQKMVIEKIREKYPDKDITAHWDSYDKEMVVEIKDLPSDIKNTELKEKGED